MHKYHQTIFNILTKLIPITDFETALREYFNRNHPKFKRSSDDKIWKKLLIDDSIEEDEFEEEESDEENSK